MSFNFYSIVLVVLRVLMSIKRLIFWIFGFIWAFVLYLDELYLTTVGFRLYRSIERLKKRFHKFSFTQQEGIVGILGRRGVLQIVIFIIAFSIMLPHSRLYTRSYDDVAGRDTLLYSLIGPGSQEYESYEVVSDVNTPSIGRTGLWRDASVYSGDVMNISGNGVSENFELTSSVAGGSAFTKPSIIPGANLSSFAPNDTANPNSNRSEVLVYEVQSGDVIGSIADQFGIKIETLLWANNLTARSYIRPGQKLSILPIDGVVHTVARGDTLSKISNLYDAKTEQIVAYNQLESATAIKAGQQLIIPDGVRPAPKPVVTSAVTSQPSGSADGGTPPPSLDVPAGVGYVWPSGATIITQYFGLRHTGLDIAGRLGLPIYAIKAGTVITSQCGWNGGYGCHIKVDHGGGLVSLYAHASDLYVAVGDTVTQGQTIAIIGLTGRTTGPHVHFEIRLNGKYQNPLSYVRK